MKEWMNTLVSKRTPRTIIACQHSTGIGDKIHVTPALREYKKKFPDREIVLLIDFSPEIFRGNPNVDYIAPYYACNFAYNTKAGDVFKIFDWSFYEHHQYDHIVARNMLELIGDFGMEKYDYSMEMFSSGEIPYEKNFDENKTPVAISPAYTMKSRMYSREHWQEVVDYLNSANYEVHSFGAKETDFDLEGVVDVRGQYKINEIPAILDKFEHVICINSGFLNIAACTKHVHIVHINQGQFPSRLFDPVRRGKLGWNCDTIEHGCELKDVCFRGHIEETILGEQLRINRNKYGKEQDDNMIKKFTAWHYCAQEEEENKYKCGKLIHENVMEYLEKNLRPQKRFLSNMKHSTRGMKDWPEWRKNIGL